MTPQTEEEKKRILDWCQQEGFAAKEINGGIGVICQMGDERIHFTVSKTYNHGSWYKWISPTFLSFTPHYRERGKPQEITLLPYPGHSGEAFLQWLQKSHAAARIGILNGTPYDAKEVFQIGQQEYLAERAQPRPRR